MIGENDPLPYFEVGDWVRDRTDKWVGQVTNELMGSNLLQISLTTGQCVNLPDIVLTSLDCPTKKIRAKDPKTWGFEEPCQSCRQQLICLARKR